MRESYSPSFAPHAIGEFEKKVDPETGRPEPIWVDLRCEKCGDRHRVRCDSGAPRNQILRWAVVHAHRDALREGIPPKEKKA